MGKLNKCKVVVPFGEMSSAPLLAFYMGVLSPSVSEYHKLSQAAKALPMK